MDEFEIKINDGSSPLSQYVVEYNSSSIQLYDWQQNAIEYFKTHNKVIFEVTTGAGKTFCAIQMIKYILEFL